MVVGDYSFINNYGNDLSNWFKSTRKKYWLPYRFGLGITIFSSIFIASLLLTYILRNVKVDDDPDGIKKAVAVAFSALLLGVICSPILLVIGRKMFPIGEFALGRGAGRQKRREHIVYSLFGGAIVLGLAVSVFGNLLTTTLTGTGAH